MLHPWHRLTSRLRAAATICQLGSLLLPASAHDTRAARTNETDLPPRAGFARCGGRVPDVLMVSSSVRVLDWVHGRTANLWPAIALHPVLVVVPASLQDWLVHAPSAGTDANDGTVP